MKKTINIFVFLLFSNTNIFAQINLVPNGDFEIYSSLPTNWAQYNLSVGWNNASGSGSPDYYYQGANTSSASFYGAIAPYSGNGQMGLITFQYGGVFREYIATHLSSSIIQGHNYIVSFYLTNGTGTGEFPQYTKGVNNFGIYFSNTPLIQTFANPINVTPQIVIDTIIYCLNYWQHFSFIYTPDYSYNYITIGNFKADTNTLVSSYGDVGAYYFVDKIEIYPFKLKIEGDSAICKGNTDTLKAFDNTTVKWADSLSPNIIIATDSLITVSPTTTTTYLAYGAFDTTSFTVHVISPPNVNLGNDTSLCQGQSLLLNAATSCSTYQWQDNSTDSIYKVTQQGTYWIKVINQFNCIGYDTINVNYKLLPQINLGNDTVLCSGKVIVLNATNTSSIYHWQDSSTASTYIVNLQGTYWVRVTNQYNCSAYDTVNIMYKECEDTLIIPNIFTPNGDAFNDYFVIKNSINWNINLEVFNRWGNVIYEADNYQNNWDGKCKGNPLADGTYFYIIKAKGKDTGKEKEYNGSLMIMR